MQDTKATVIAYTHPSPVLSILYNQTGASLFQRHIFPELIPVCGIAPAVVYYVDPGFALAKPVQDPNQE